MLLGTLFLGLLSSACQLGLDALQVRFPGNIVGLLCLFATLGVARNFAEPAVEHIVGWLAPARRFLARWMALFFVPPLVLVSELPLPRVRGLLSVGLIVLLGFCGTFWLAGFLAQRLSPDQLPPPSVRQPASPGWPRRHVLGIWASAAVLAGWASLTAFPGWGHIPLGVCGSVVLFSVAEGLQEGTARRWPTLAAFLHPVPLSAALIWLGWRALGNCPADYWSRQTIPITPGSVLTHLLGPAVVALALSLDAERELLRSQGKALLGATSIAATLSLVLTALAAAALQVPAPYGRALLARSVTSPVALSIAGLLDANPGLTAVFVIATGVLGAVLSAPLSRLFGLRTPFVVGIATGVASHGIGTAALARRDPAAAAFSGVAFALVAIVSVVISSTRLMGTIVLALVP